MWFEIQGLPAVSIASSEFAEAADVQRRALGMEGARCLLVDHPIQDATDDEMRAKADEAFEEILREPAGFTAIFANI